MVFLMIFVVFASSAAVTWKGSHMKLEAFVQRLPARLRRGAMVATTLFSTGLLLVLAWASFHVVSTLYRFDQQTDALELPMWIPQSFVLGGLVVISVMIVLRLVVIGADVADEDSSRNEEVGS